MTRPPDPRRHTALPARAGGVRAWQRRVAAAGALAALAPGAAACPYCAVSQGLDTLIYIMGFLIIPYVVVGGTWWWMKRLLASEREG